jgi:hypothetical protein
VGLILCSSTRLEDVPCADAFSVEDTLVVSILALPASALHVYVLVVDVVPVCCLT